MKIIFLDVDGVLNSCFTIEVCGTVPRMRFVEEKYVELLRQIVEATEAKIVLSSDWRYRWKELMPKPEGEGPFGELKEMFKAHGMGIYSTTPLIEEGEFRGVEVKAWMREQTQSGLEIDSYVILDDQGDFLTEQLPYLVRTYADEGLTERDARQAIEILNTKKS